MSNIKVAAINASTALKDDAVKAAVAVLQTQVRRDFAPPWGVDADLTYAMRPRIGSRRERCRTPRDQWLQSKV